MYEVGLHINTAHVRVPTSTLLRHRSQDIERGSSEEHEARIHRTNPQTISPSGEMTPRDMTVRRVSGNYEHEM